jgi:hypothetical protein
MKKISFRKVTNQFRWRCYVDGKQTRYYIYQYANNDFAICWYYSNGTTSASSVDYATLNEAKEALLKRYNVED